MSPRAWLEISVRGNRKSGGTHISVTADYAPIFPHYSFENCSKISPIILNIILDIL